MKYLVIADVKSTGDAYDEFIEEFENEEDAVTNAKYEWNRLCDSDRKRRTAFYVLESANPDEDADDHFEGKVIRQFTDIS